MRKLQTVLLVAAMLGFAAGSAQAQELLSNGDLDTVSTEQAPGWTLDETVTGMPGTPTNSGQIQDFANHDAGGTTGLWLRAFAGNTDNLAGQDQATNADLSQTVPGVAGETYTFSGWSRWEANYSGGVANLDIDKMAPPDMLGPPSPTQTFIVMSFLDAGMAPIDQPAIDLRAVQMNDNMWRQQSITQAAPAGTAFVRVNATASDMKFNVDPGQSAFFDDFSLTAASAPAAELLTNGKLNDVPQIPGWTLIEGPAGKNTAEQISFADHPGDAGELGLWLRPFVSDASNPLVDATLTQTVGVLPGREITFTGWSRWEDRYSGGEAATPTQTLMRMEFLDAANAVVGAPITLDVGADRTAQSPTMDPTDNQWYQHSLFGIVPSGATSLRVSGIADNMFNTTGSQSAFFDDFSVRSVPEPTSAVLVMFGMLGFAGLTRRR